MGDIQWRGVFPALTTKFRADGGLDFEAMERHLSFQLEAGVHGLIILGSLGENSTLVHEEKRAMVEFFGGIKPAGIPLVVCIAESSTAVACELVQESERFGADAFMVLPPMRYPSDRRETMMFLGDVAAAASRPLMLYNNPVAYGTDILPEDFRRLADNAKFAAIKESSADTRRIGDIRRLCGDRYAVFCGVDDLALECFAMGACGWVAGLVVAFPAETVKLWELCEAGRWNEARAIYEWFLPLLHLDIGPKFVQQIKLIESLMGVGSARVRPPRQQLTEAEASAIEATLAEALSNRPAL